ncbi:purine-cytosine permease family protein [Rhodococcus koreensis]
MSLGKYFAGPSTSLDDQVESFATSRVPATQRWPRPAILLVLTANVTAMFWFSLGGQMGFLLGWPWMLLPLAYMVLFATVFGSMIMRICSREGLSVPLLTRGLGFGSKGAAVASVVYGFNYVFYFIFEGSIVAHALSEMFDISINSWAATVVFAFVGLAALIFAWRGMHSMNLLQKWGTPIFLVLFVIGMFMLANGYVLTGPGQWEATGGVTAVALWQGFNLANGQIIFQALIATDYGRFVKTKVGYRGTGALMFVELMMIVAVMLIGALISFTLLPTLGSEASATDPGLYFIVIMGFIGVIFAVVTQVRINVVNLYSGSLALSNAWDAVAPRKIGRQWWMVGLFAVGILGYPINILNYTGTFLAVTGIMTNTWILILLADYFVCRKLFKLAPTRNIAFEDDKVRPWNPCGLISMGVGVFVGALGVLGVYPVYFASFLAMLIGPALHIPLTLATKGRYYFPVVDDPEEDPKSATDAVPAI